MSTAGISQTHSEPLAPVDRKLPWLFSPRVDLSAFLGSALLALALLGVGKSAGILHSDSPEWTWVTAILLIDVAHVYATGFRVYFVPEEFRRRRGLYLTTPFLAFAIGWAIYSESQTGPMRFWRILAYMAVFHFVRQQYGWVALYRAKARESSQTGRWIDTVAIYMATVYPLVWWHAHLPRNFWWFLEEDFVRAPELLTQILQPVYWTSLGAYFGRSLWQGFHNRHWNPGKDIVVATTAVCWYVGIITFNSDYAFTVTNVIIHGVPYFVLVYWHRYMKTENPGSKRPNETTPSRHIRRVIVFLATLWLLAYVEELLWYRGVWGDRAWLFGEPWSMSAKSSSTLKSVLVPLLAVPQITHYVLDGFIWRRRSNPDFRQTVEGKLT